MHDEDQAPPDLFKDLVKYCQQKALPLITSTDCNAHHTLWGSTNINARGEDLMQYIIQENLKWENIGNTPTFSNAIRDEVLDITLTNPQASQMVQYWKVDPLPSLSDHALITYNITSQQTSTRQSRNIKRTDWDKYREHLSHDLNHSPRETLTTEDLDEQVNNLTNKITAAYENSCPTSYIKKTKATEWWTEELNIEKEKINKLYHNKNTNPRDQNIYNQWKEGQKSFKKLIRKTKRENWRKFCKETKTLSAAAKLTKILKKKTPPNIQTLLKQDNTYTQTQKETLELLVETHAPTRPTPNKQFQPTEPKYTHTPNMINQQRLNKAKTLLENNKVPGPDEILNEHITQGWDILLPHLICIYRSCINLNHIPTAWHSSRGVFITKPGRKTYTSPKDYRTITLSSNLLKLLERLILWHIDEDLHVTRHMSTQQYGFTRGYSTDTALNKLISKVENSIINGNYALGIFLDIEGAFDNISFTSIEGALQSLSLPPHICNIISSLVRNRITTFNLGEHSITKLLSQGCPQGGVISPFLWNLTLNSLLIDINKFTDILQAYADDLCLLTQGIDIATIYSIAQTHLTSINTWCIANKLSLSTIKTKIILFTWRRPPIRYSIQLGNTRIPLSFNTKYLGITLDRHLSWEPHLTELYEKTTKILYSCKQITSKTWGTNPKITKWIYTQIIRPIISYGSMSWLNALNKITTLTQMQRIQNLALRIITGTMRSTPTDALEAITNILPINIYIQQTAINTAYRLKNYDNINFIQTPGRGKLQAHQSIIAVLTQDITSFTHSSDLTKPSINISHQFKTQILNRQEAAEYTNNVSNLHNIINIYTDGSKNTQSAGSGVYIPHNHHVSDTRLTYSHSSHTTVYQTEVHAITMACNKIQEQDIRQQKIIIHTDSQATIHGINSLFPNSKTTLQCINALKEIAKNNTVIVTWVPGHSGIQGNEIADQLANQGTDTNEPDSPILPLARGAFKHTLKQWAHKKHCKQWSTTTHCKRTKNTSNNS